MLDKETRYAYILLFVGLLAVSTSAVLVKLTNAPSSIIAFYRLFFTVLIILIPTMLFHRKDFIRLSLRQWLYSFLSGIFLAFHFITWFESLKYTSVASSVVLVTLQPIFAMIGVYIIFKHRVSPYGIIGTLLALSGSFVIGYGDFQIGGQALYGDILAVVGALLVTGYWIIGQSLRKQLSLLPYIFLVYGTSTIVLYFYNLLSRKPFFSYSNYDWIVFLSLAIFPTIFGHTLFNWSIKYVSATTISVTILGEPVGATILAYFILAEKISVPQLVGGVIILVGIFVYLKYNKSQK